MNTVVFCLGCVIKPIHQKLEPDCGLGNDRPALTYLFIYISHTRLDAEQM